MKSQRYPRKLPSNACNCKSIQADASRYKQMQENITKCMQIRPNASNINTLLADASNCKQMQMQGIASNCEQMQANAKQMQNKWQKILRISIGFLEDFLEGFQWISLGFPWISLGIHRISCGFQWISL